MAIGILLPSVARTDIAPPPRIRKIETSITKLDEFLRRMSDEGIPATLSYDDQPHIRVVIPEQFASAAERAGAWEIGEFPSWFDISRNLVIGLALSAGCIGLGIILAWRRGVTRIAVTIVVVAFVLAGIFAVTIWLTASKNLEVRLEGDGDRILVTLPIQFKPAATPSDETDRPPWNRNPAFRGSPEKTPNDPTLPEDQQQK